MRTFNSKPTRQPWQCQVIRFAPYIAVGVILIILPPLTSSYIQSLMTKILVFALFAMSLDIIYGYTGLWSFGHAIFFGVGAYTVAILMVDYGIKSLWIGVSCGVLVGGLVAAVIGFIALRVSGIYFLLITFALGQMFYSIAWKWKWLCRGGIEGIPGISRPDIGIPGFTWDTLSFYYFILIGFVICYFLLRLITNSPFGHALKGIREGEPRMQALGYNTWLYKYLAFIVAGMFASAAGVLFVYHNGIVVPVHLGASTSALAMLMVIVGGAGTLVGAPIGACLVIIVEHFASIFTPERWPLILGAVYVGAAMYARGGISIHLIRWWDKMKKQWKC